MEKGSKEDPVILKDLFYAEGLHTGRFSAPHVLPSSFKLDIATVIFETFGFDPEVEFLKGVDAGKQSKATLEKESQADEASE